MKTVQDYLDLGLVFVGGDKICGITGDSSSRKLNIFDRSICAKQYNKGAAKIGADCYARARWTPSSFAWRNNDGVKPEYKGLIDVCFEGGTVSHNESAIDFEWSLDDENYIAKWRPVVSMCNHTELKPRRSFVTAVSIDGPKFTIKEETPSSTMTVNIEGRDYLIPSRTPTVSPKEDKPMKPVYTAEMHARNELPPVDSKVKVCIEEAGFYVDEQDVKFEGKDVTVKAAFSNTESEKIVAVENEDGNCYCYIIECIKPIIKTIKVNGFDVPAPMGEALDGGSEYFVIDILSDSLVSSIEWECDDKDSQWLSRGIIHSTESAAITHAKAMLGIDPNA